MNINAKGRAIYYIIVLLFINISCNKDKKIRRELNSKYLSEQMEGTYEAGLSGNKEYVPLLLHNAADPSASTSLYFKGFTLYTAKMFALECIFHAVPPHSYKKILTEPDSVNIKFFEKLWKEDKSH